MNIPDGILWKLVCALIALLITVGGYVWASDKSIQDANIKSNTDRITIMENTSIRTQTSMDTQFEALNEKIDMQNQNQKELIELLKKDLERK